MASRDSEICGLDLLARSRSRSGSVQLYRPPPGAGGQWFSTNINYHAEVRLRYPPRTAKLIFQVSAVLLRVP